MNDLISREEALETLRYLTDFVCDKEYEDGKVLLFQDSALDRIAELEPAQRWIPVTERLPEDFEEVNVTWVNRAPEQYYADIKDIPFVASGVFYKGRWYWWSAVCADYLREYGNSPNDIMDDSIEVIAWMPLPEPYEEAE